MRLLQVLAAWLIMIAAFTGCGGMVDETKTTTLGTIAFGNYPSMKVTSSGIYISYHTSSGLQFMKSADKGITWTKTSLDTGTEAGNYSSIAVNGTNVYISYSIENGSDHNLKFIKSADSGATWSTAVTVDSYSDVGEFNSIAVNNNNTVMISYFDNTTDNLKAAYSTDGGTNWNNTNVDSTNFVGQYTSIAVNSLGYFFISYWYGTASSTYTWGPTLRVASTTDAGQTWGISTISDSSLCYGLNTSICASGNIIHIAYIDTSYYTFYPSTNTFSPYTSGQIKVVSSLDSGGSWSTPVSIAYLSNISTYLGNKIGIAFNGTNVYVSYADVTLKRMNIAKSTDSGTTWGTPVVIDAALNKDYTYYYSSQLAASPTYVYAVYVDGYTDIVFATSTDGGATWTW